MPDQRDPSKIAVTVYIERDLKEKVQTRARERGETLTEVITRGLKRYSR